MNEDKLLKLENISISFKANRKKILTPIENFSFDLNYGDFIGVVGDSGSGKSTLLHFIAGFLRPKIRHKYLDKIMQYLPGTSNEPLKVSGKILIDGQDVTKAEPYDRSVGLVMQDFNLYPHMTVYKNLRFPLRMNKNLSAPDIKEKIKSISERLEIEDLLDRLPKDLSQGQKQRVAIGKAILRYPKIILFDEAFSNLDWRLRERLLRDVVKPLTNTTEILPNRCGIIFVTHNLEDIKDAKKIISIENEHNAPKSHINVFPNDSSRVNNAYKQFIDQL